MKTLKLYAVNYCEMETHKNQELLKTHSKEKAIRMAEFIKKSENVLYAQVVTYVYNEHVEFYEFITLKNYYNQ